jgi:sigma-B regulation protein RsbU (phosphoserine phosphatase)
MLLGVFSLFASIGLVSLLIIPHKQTWASALSYVLVSGGFAVGYALFSILRKFAWLTVWGVLHAFTFLVLARVFPPAIVGEKNSLQTQILVLGLCAISTVVVGYVLFIVFIRREGNRYFRIQAEIELAREIHHSLVPTVERQIPGFELFGMSIASSEVGGDLVDVAEFPGGFVSYIADVSGHGVSAGVLMAMFKTSIRSLVVNGGSAGELLNEVHRALYPLKMTNMFVTAGVLQLSDGDTVNFSLAGHPPLMRYSSAQRKIVEYSSQNLPLGVVLEQRFATDTLRCDPGDVLLLLTDGFTEVFKRNGAELGLEPIKRAFIQSAERPLPEIFATLRKVALDFGRQEDDQTMLLVRYVG